MTSQRNMDPRNRLVSGVNRRRLQQEAKRSVVPTVVFVLGVALAIVIGALFVVNISETFGRSTYKLRFEVQSAFGVFEGFDDVRFRGVPAGNIAKIERDGSQIILVAEIRDEFGPVYKDARAEVRPITPLNDIYLDIVDPGTRGAGEATATEPIPEDQTRTSVTVPEVLDGVTADARANAYRLLDNLGNGMDDGGLKLRRAFVSLAPFLTEAGQVTEQIALHKQQTQRLIHNTSLLTEELGRRETQLKRLISTGAATMGTLQEGSADLDRTLAELGPTFTELEAGLAAVRGIVDDVDTGLQSLYPVADRLPAGLRSLQTLSDTLAPAAKDLKPAVEAFYGWTLPVTELLAKADRITSGLLPETPIINRTAQRLVDCEKGVIGFFQWNSSLSKFGDTSGGPIPRGNLAIGAPQPASGAPLRDPEVACTPGFPTRAVPTREDEH